MGARAVDWARLESVCTARYRGFESLPIRFREESPGMKVLYILSDSSNMSFMMRWPRTSWFLALLAMAVALVLTSCASQEGIGPAEGELSHQNPGGSGY